MKTLILAIGLFASVNAFAAQNEGQSSQSSSGHKTTRASQIRAYGLNCGQHEMDLFEQRNGRPPTDDEMDMIIDACVNPTFKQ